MEEVQRRHYLGAGIIAGLALLPRPSLRSLLLGAALGSSAILGALLLLLRSLFPVVPSDAAAAAAVAAEHDAKLSEAEPLKPAPGATGGSAQRGYIHICTAAQASLKPKPADAQSAVKRCVALPLCARACCLQALAERPRSYALLSQDQLVLSAEPGAAAQSVLSLRGCSVCCAPDPSGPGAERRWWRRLPVIVAHQGRELWGGESAVALFFPSARRRRRRRRRRGAGVACSWCSRPPPPAQAPGRKRRGSPPCVAPPPPAARQPSARWASATALSSVPNPPRVR
jgi:hypothetical protein